MVIEQPAKRAWRTCAREGATRDEKRAGFEAICGSVEIKEEPFNGWTVKDRAWYLAQLSDFVRRVKGRSSHQMQTVRASNWPMEQEWAHFCFAGGNIQMMNQGRHEGKIFINDVTNAYPGKLVRARAMAIPIEWEIKKDGSRGDAIKFVHGQWKWRDAAELAAEAIERMSPYSMIDHLSCPRKGTVLSRRNSPSVQLA